jgi:hypothetical protein
MALAGDLYNFLETVTIPMTTEGGLQSVLKEFHHCSFLEVEHNLRLPLHIQSCSSSHRNTTSILVFIPFLDIDRINAIEIRCIDSINVPSPSLALARLPSFLPLPPSLSLSQSRSSSLNLSRFEHGLSAHTSKFDALIRSCCLSRFSKINPCSLHS